MMKRFYETVEAVLVDVGWGVSLDGKSVKTPAKQSLHLPTIALAQGVVQEWQDQNDEIEPLSMPLTRFANAALDRTGAMRGDVIEQVCAYGQSDMLCYRVDEPVDLAERQLTEWQPQLDWLSRAHSIELKVTAGIVLVEQSASALAAIKDVVSSFDDFRLTGLHVVTTACGSIALGLALADGCISAEEALKLAALEELYQMEAWGEDPETLRRHDELRREITNASKFMTLALAGA